MADNPETDNGADTSDDRESDTLRIAILGICPISIEAALYGRYLGYEVVLFGPDEVCRPWRDDTTTMSSPFRENCTPLGLAALDAQANDYQHPQPDATLSYQQWVESYCIPLSCTDLVRTALRLESPVKAVVFHRVDETFQIVASQDAGALPEQFDYVIQPNDLGAPLRFEAADVDDYLILDGQRPTNGSLDFQAAIASIVRAYRVIGERVDLNVYETLPQYKL